MEYLILVEEFGGWLLDGSFVLRERRKPEGDDDVRCWYNVRYQAKLAFDCTRKENERFIRSTTAETRWISRLIKLPLPIYYSFQESSAPAHHKGTTRLHGQLPLQAPAYVTRYLPILKIPTRSKTSSKRYAPTLSPPMFQETSHSSP